ncbi:hypothetical protein ACYSNO_11190 [Enterococcus sp. LJL98]
MYSQYNQKFDIYRYEDLINFSKNTNTVFNELKNIYENVEMREFCDILKISPFVTDLNSAGRQGRKKKLIFDKLSDFIEKEANSEELIYWRDYKKKVVCINEMMEDFFEFRENYFLNHQTNQKLDGCLLVVSAELIMKELSNIFNPNVEFSDGRDNLENRANTYDAYIGFVSNVIKFFLFENIPFNVSSKIYSDQDTKIASRHFGLNSHWDEMTDVVEYFRFSDVNIEKNTDGYVVEIVDKNFDKTVLISNFREKNYLESLNDSITSDLNRRNIKFSRIGKRSEYLSLQHCKRIFGIENLNTEILGVSIIKWISAYFFIREQAAKKLKTRKEINQLNELCVVKPIQWWRKQLIKYNSDITFEEAKQIINMFIFDKESKDLIDNPLILFKDQLVLIPSIVFDLSAEIALVSLLSHKNLQINFKGNAFEKRLQKKLKLHNINAHRIAAHVKDNKNKENYETDLVFVLNRTMFILECKSIVPPYTVKDHAKTNAKIINEIDKFKKNAGFFEENQEYVKQKLNISNSVEITEFVRIFITSSTLGMAGYFDGMYVIDEAAFNAFLFRNPPVIRDTDMNIYAKKNRWDFEGNLTAAKIKYFLSDPPSLRFMEHYLKRREHKIDNMKITRYSKEIPSRFLNMNNLNIDHKKMEDAFKQFIKEF